MNRSPSANATLPSLGADPTGFFVRHRHLIYELVRRDVRDKYTGRLLGGLWAVLSPLALMGVYVAVFTFIYAARLSDFGAFRGDYTSLLIAGLIPWLVIQDALARSVTSVTSQASLARQIAFPTAVLPIKTVLASAPIAIVSTVFLLGYQLLAGPPPPMMALLLPLYWMVFAIYCIGFALLLAALNVFMRDLSEIIGIVFSAGLFLSPILFIPGLAPPWLEQVYHFNPFSYAIWVHRDIVFHGAITEPSAWIGFGFLSAGLFVAGAALFSRLEDHFGDAL